MFYMKKFLGIIFLIFIFNSSASADQSMVNTCNKVLEQLKNYGYNFQNFTSGSLIIRNLAGVQCEYPPNSEQIVSFFINPARFHVTDPGMGNLNGHCIYPSSGQIKRLRLNKCRGY